MTYGIGRREFLQSVAAIAAASRAGAQTPATNEWGSQVLDMHLHPRATVEGNLLHIDGSGVTKAVLLTGAAAERAREGSVAAHPNRFVRFASIDMKQPDASTGCRRPQRAAPLDSVKSSRKSPPPGRDAAAVRARRRAEPAGHDALQESTSPTVGNVQHGLEAVRRDVEEGALRLIGHADAFWANVSADYAEDTSYPKGPIKPGGVTDRFLADYPNLYADMSANSANNFLNRDPEFAAPFLVRHQNKLMFGSDCPCPDGRGGASGRYVARATLTMLKKLAPPDVFRKIVWENGTRLLKI
jgi:hypothetical protein